MVNLKQKTNDVLSELFLIQLHVFIIFCIKAENLLKNYFQFKKKIEY